MATNNQDAFARAYAMLSALRKNIDQAIMRHGVPETYVREYHTVLDRLENIKVEISEFRIPDSEFRISKSEISPTVINYGAPRGKYVFKAFILTKLDAILDYFEIITSEKPRKIGFHPPDNQ